MVIRQNAGEVLAHLLKPCMRDTTCPRHWKSEDLSNYGLHDMAGNVWEWVNDLYSDSYYASSPQNNPSGPASSTLRVVRGGCWGSSTHSLRDSNRGYGSPDFYHSVFGFRVARDP
jgi:formylglycine-generating enzyme required for sulfatase activity